MTKRGRTPSLIGGGAGKSKVVEAKGTRTCKRCGNKIYKGVNCVEVAIPGSMGHKNYCIKCYKGILEQTQKDLNNIVEEIGLV